MKRITRRVLVVTTTETWTVVTAPAQAEATQTDGAQGTPDSEPSPAGDDAGSQTDSREVPDTPAGTGRSPVTFTAEVTQCKSTASLSLATCLTFQRAARDCFAALAMTFLTY